MAEVDQDTVSNFTNDSAMMIAYERALETKRGDDALFQDPFAEIMAGEKGQGLSEAFGKNGHYFGFEGWEDFHKSWTAVRTRFIDDRVAEHAKTGNFAQLVNLGAGFDTRAYRLDSYAAFANGAFEVDMQVINDGKRKNFAEVLKNPTAHCEVHIVDVDFLDEEKTLLTALPAAGSFSADKPTLFLAEGLIMYLGSTGKTKLLRDVSAVAAPGSVFVLQFMDPGETWDGGNGLSKAEATETLTENGWDHIRFWKFGDDELNFGRFPTDKFKPSASFSFLVCVKQAP